jgi:hypothetical protein
VVEINELISRRSDGVSLGNETVTYAGPRYSRFMSAYRKDPKIYRGKEFFGPDSLVLEEGLCD